MFLLQLSSKTAGGNVHVHLDNRGHEDYVPPPPPSYVAFGGAGAALGGGLAVVSSNFTVEMMSQVDPPVLNESAPSTTLQIRLHDGRKLRLK